MPAADDAALFDSLAEHAAGFGFELTPAQIGQFVAFTDLLQQWSARVSLLSAGSREEIVNQHIVDAFAVASLVGPGMRVADLGSGAGFPGVPVAIARPEATVILVESRRKRANFLRAVARFVRLPNVVVCEQRIEDIGIEFPVCDAVASRAVWPIAEFLAVAVPLLRSGGAAIAMKTPKALEEARQPPPAFTGPRLIPYDLPAAGARVLIVYVKR